MEVNNENNKFNTTNHEKEIERIFNKFSKDQINYIIPEHRKFIENFETIKRDGITYIQFNETIFENLQMLLDLKTFKSSEPKKKQSNNSSNSNIAILDSNIIENCDYKYCRDSRKGAKNNHKKGEVCGIKATCTVVIKGKNRFRCTAHKTRKN